MKLTEFLLARLAEDEGMARHAWPERYTDRMLAECEAKRQRVAILAEMERSQRNLLSSYGYSLLCREALPYAAHPDFREEWKP